MEINEAYGYGTGVPSSFGEPVGFNYVNFYDPMGRGGAGAGAGAGAPPPAPAFNNYYNINYNINSLGGNNNNNNINPFYFDPTTYNNNNNNTINTTSIPTFNTPPPIPTITTTSLSPNNLDYCTNTTDTNTIGTFPGAPFSSTSAINYNYNINNNNSGLPHQNYYENSNNMLVMNTSVQQPLPIGSLDEINTHQDAQMIGMPTGVNSADHLGSLVFSDGENSINGRLNKKKRNVSRPKRSSFLPFDQFHFHHHVPPPEPARVIDESRLKFLFQKQLQNSDVNNLKRMVIPKKPAETFLPRLDERSGISIDMVEIDRSQMWTFSYRFWPNNKSRMYILENTGEFVNKHKLRSGDFITVYEDTESKEYVIEATKPIRNNVVYKPKPKKVRNHCHKAQAETDNDTPMTDGPAVAPSLEDGKGLPVAATNEMQLIDSTTAGNYMQVPNNGFETCISSSIIDNVPNFLNPVDNTTSLIYNDMNFPNDYLFNMWERGTSSNQSVPSFQNLSFDDILKGM